MIQKAVLIGLAYILDLLFGDPPLLPHPVRGVGFLAEKLEAPIRKGIQNQRWAGVLFAALIVGMVYFGTLAMICMAARIHPLFSFAIAVFFIYTSLAIKDLKVETLRVYEALEKGDLILARKNLSLVVGRDTDHLDEKEIIRATVETIAENITDGMIAPLFYAFLGGAPAALAYKATNTLDSMVGYKNERYEKFGWASARLDDVLNFIPARFSALILPVVSGFLGWNGANAFKIVLRDGRKNPSPNSGIPEAAVAGALGIRLGGLNFYRSVPVEKPFIGEAQNPLSLSHIKDSMRIAYGASFFALLIILMVAFFLR